MHEWITAEDKGHNACMHGPLAVDVTEKPWLKEGSDDSRKFNAVVVNPRSIYNVRYYLNFRSNAELETFKQHILMYTDKRFAYPQARNFIAALDHIIHVDRPPLLNKPGEVVYHTSYKKESG